MAAKRKRHELDDNSENRDSSNIPAPKAMRLNNNARLECKEWDCSVCTFINKPSSLQCSMCEQPKIIQKDSNHNNNNNNNILSFLCVECKINEGYDIPCTKTHKLCINCCKNYILDGINNNLWKKQPLSCPSSNNDCTNGIIPYWLINQCNLNDEQKSSLQSQQNLYNIFTISKCNICQTEIGIDLQCDHNLCITDAKKYILNGIVNNKWKTQKLSCPIKHCESELTLSILKQLNLSQNIENKLNEMQNEYNKNSITSNPNITQCPKCNTPYSTEIGDINIENVNTKENLSIQHKKHKTKFRFRCLKPGCNVIFCSGCKTIPYHVGYSCVEYKQYKQSKKCRFCNISLADNSQHDILILNDNVCTSHDCLRKKQIICNKIYDCGHNCIGIKNHKCFGCLNKQCLPKNADINENDFCNICWVDELKSAPSLKLECGHYFHYDCVKQKISKKWPSARITFGFLNCPLCKKIMKHFSLKEICEPFNKLQIDIEAEAIERVRIEGLENDKRLMDKNSIYYNNLGKYSMDRLAFYPCSKCKKSYFGGMKACQEAGREEEEKYNENHLICGGCACGDKKEKCNMHGTNYITWKCKFCCSLAVWFCWGTTHFCDPCHRVAYQKNKAKIETLPKCPGKDKCPLGIQHAANGTAEVCLGCVVCLRK